jgi:hypothetical protein
VRSFPDASVGLHDSGNPPFQTSGSFSNFEAEFKTWKQPSESLDPNSFVFSAAEIFRFLRDMALDLPAIHSTSLLNMDSGKGEGVRNREKNFYGAPPVTSRMGRGSMPAQHLIHPGAVLCMMDLLPSLTVTEDFLQPEKGSSEYGRASTLSSGRGLSPPVGVLTTPPKSAKSGLNDSNRSPSCQSEDSFYDAVGDEGKTESSGFVEGQVAKSALGDRAESEDVVEPAFVDVVGVIVEGEEREAEYCDVEELKQVSVTVY